MLFNSFRFIFAFLPIAYIGYWLTRPLDRLIAPHISTAWLGLASLWFYLQSDAANGVLLGFSIAFNFLVGWVLVQVPTSTRKAILALGVIIDLGLIAFYKYSLFAVQSLNTLTGTGFATPAIELPIGISFFTFTQIAFLVDTYRGLDRARNPVSYLLFVTLFPHLIAGPILHHKEMVDQFGRQGWRSMMPDLVVGLTIFSIGLFKKVALADTLAGPANAVFDAAAAGDPIPTFTAWAGTFAYTFQIYFDFSGYSDMAIGLARIFGLQLPINFASPYKATSISDFWRRWHITLSRFLRDYLYIPLGGNRRHRLINLIATMLLGGLWHGAGWTFVLWGGLHGLYLIAHQMWRRFGPGTLSPWTGRVLTLLCVALAWVPFRAPNLAATGQVYAALLGMGGGSLNVSTAGLYSVLVGLLLVWALPNVSEIMRNYGPGLCSPGYPATILEPSDRGRLVWSPTPVYAVATALLLGFSIAKLNDLSKFIYFQF